MTDEFTFQKLQTSLLAWTETSIGGSTAKDRTLERLRHALGAWKTSATPFPIADLAPLFRQVLVREQTDSRPETLIVPSTGEWPRLGDWKAHGINVVIERANYVRMSVDMPRLSFLGGGEDIFDDAYRELPSQVSHRIPIEPFLREAFHFDSYTCEGQREAVRALFLLPDGETLIANLPTGSGKSMLLQAPVLVEGWQGRLTVVVLPTVALVLDQARRMQELLEARYPERDWTQLAYYGSLLDTEKQAIRRHIRDGEQGIVFAAPESITTGLAPAVHDAAERGFLRYLFIDEAHLVTAWGDGFRLDFQILAGQRRALLAAFANRPFKTILASATLTTDAISSLRQMFGTPDRTMLISAVHLRPEPRYWYKKAPDAATRRSWVLEAVASAPRPLILYATTRVDVDNWARELTRGGYKRHASFHGGTEASERARVLREWSAGSIDIVVANSAFGLGVDKSDVRAIIHATVPESLDRFYQEVGRAGRDGAACASLSLWTDEDIEIAARLSRVQLIGDEKGFRRWRSMIAKSTVDPANSSVIEVDLDTLVPKAEQESLGSRYWNTHTVLLGARAGLVELVTSASELEIDGEELVVRATCKLRILNERHANEAFWIQTVSESRAETERRSERGLSLLLDVLSHRKEVGVSLVELYTVDSPGTSVAVAGCCAGCPDHWNHRSSNPPYHGPVVDISNHIAQESLEGWRTLMPGTYGRRQLAFYDAIDQSMNGVLSVLEKVVLNAPIQEIVLEGRFEQNVRSRISAVLQKVRRPIFLESLGSTVTPSFDYRTGTIRVCIIAPEVDKPHTLTRMIDASRFELVILPTDQKDPFHPLRFFKDTASGYTTLSELARALQ